MSYTVLSLSPRLFYFYFVIAQAAPNLRQISQLTLQTSEWQTHFIVSHLCQDALFTYNFH